jgi:hypothetical protein
MKIILIQDTVYQNGYTGFLNEHPALVIAVDKPEHAHQSMREAAHVFLRMALDDGDTEMGAAMLKVKEMDTFEVVTYDIPQQYKLIKEKLLKS